MMWKKKRMVVCGEFYAHFVSDLGQYFIQIQLDQKQLLKYCKFGIDCSFLCMCCVYLISSPLPPVIIIVEMFFYALFFRVPSFEIQVFNFKWYLWVASFLNVSNINYRNLIIFNFSLNHLSEFSKLWKEAEISYFMNTFRKSLDFFSFESSVCQYNDSRNSQSLCIFFFFL